MAILEIQDVSFRYPGAERPVLDRISLAVEPGEFVLLCGASGCGKTTLLRHIKRELAPVGVRSGEVRFQGRPLSSYEDRFVARNIGMVQQSPDNQTVTDRVLSELVFTMENVGFETGLMRRRAAELSHYFGLDALLGKHVHELSGGQKQLVQLASVLALQPQVLLLDEPTAQLDPLAARELIQLLQRINQDFGLTIIAAEHRYEELLPAVDRVVAFENGSIRHAGQPREVVRAFAESGWDDFVPAIPKLLSAHSGGWEGDVPLTVKEGRRQLRQLPALLAELELQAAAGGTEIAEAAEATQTDLLEGRELCFQYAPHAEPVLKAASLRVCSGEVLAIVGANGSGKTTLLQAMAGILKPQKGKLLFHGKPLARWDRAERTARIGYLAQNPLTFFIEETVERELRQAAARSQAVGGKRSVSARSAVGAHLIGADSTGLSDDPTRLSTESADTVLQVARSLGLDRVLGSHPCDLSEGERQLAALAALLLTGAELLLLDEPTKGLDPAAKRRWGERLQELQQDGKTIVMVTHDLEFAAEYATRCAMMFDGMLAAEGAPQPFFRDNLYYTTAACQLLRGD